MMLYRLDIIPNFETSAVSFLVEDGQHQGGVDVILIGNDGRGNYLETGEIPLQI